MEPNHAVILLSALAQRSRLAVFRRLVECGPDGAHPSDLAQQLQLPPNTLSFHLKALAHAGLVAARQSGRNIRYTADFAAMQSLIGYLTENCCGGNPSLCMPEASAGGGCAPGVVCAPEDFGQRIGKSA
jgi:DNA-binding transcriptional ArsR family regulator